MGGRRKARAAAAGLVLLLSAACGGSGATQATAVSGESALRDACGEELVLQTDWFPEPEHGGLYQLIGGDGTVDAEKGSYRGEIGDTGVALEIRAGGPFSGDQNVSSLMYQSEDIDLGFVNTDEAVEQSGKLPTVAVFAPLSVSPSALMWDPAVYDFDSFDDIGASEDAKVLHFEGTKFVDYLVGKGLVRKDQLDPSYDGSPSRFVASGKLVQQVYATNEPYKYENDIEQWKKPVETMLVAESGYAPYPQNIAVKPEFLASERDCLQLLVPMMQQAQVDYVRAPEEVNQALLRIVEELDTFWTLSPGLNAYVVEKLLALGIVANSPDGALGSFDMDRVQRMVELLVPLEEAQGVRTVKPGVTAGDIATNEFIDPSIAL